MSRVTHEDIARALSTDGKFYLPTQEQQAIIEAPLDPALVVAGAGSGKTQTMMLRILWLIANEQIAPQQILGLTFTRKAAGELQERIETGLDGLRSAKLITIDEFDMPQVSTYNSYANAIYSQYALLVGRDPDAVLLDEPGAFSLMRQTLLEHDDAALRSFDKPSVGHMAGVALSIARGMREMRLDAAEVRIRVDPVLERLPTLPGRTTKATDEILERLERLKLYAGIADRYEARKRDAGVVEFSDQVATAAEILELDPSIAGELREQAEVVILDEYQDTSVGQIRLLSNLFKGHNVMAVGDPKQSIYGWRGASAANMKRFGDDFYGTRRGQRFELSVSWRNDERILEAANRVAAPLPEAIGAKELGPRPGAGQGTVEHEYLLTDGDEAAHIAGWFRGLLVEDEAGKDRTAAVLVRARSHMAIIAKALGDADVPFQVLGLGGLFSTPEIVDLNSILRAAADEQAGNELIRLLVGAQFEVGLADIVALNSIARREAKRDADGRPLSKERIAVERSDAKTEDRGESLVDALDVVRSSKPGAFREWGLSELGEARMREAAELLHEVRIRLTLPLTDLVDFTIRRARLDIETVANPSRAVGRANLEAYVDAVAGYTAANPSADIHEFLDWVDLAERDDKHAEVTEVAEKKGVVQLTTMHSAKGLEWDYVSIPQLNDKVLPGSSGSSTWIPSDALPYELRDDHRDLPQFDWEHAETLDEIKHELNENKTRVLPPPVGERPSFATQKRIHSLNEDRRLAYVAVTRARSRLMLTGARWRGRNSRPFFPSPFFHEIVGDVTLACPPGSEPYALIDDERVVFTAAQTADERAEINDTLAVNPNEGGKYQVWPRPPMAAPRLARLRAAGERVVELAAQGQAAEPSGSHAFDPLIDLLLAERDAGDDEAELRLPERFGASLLHDLLDDPVAIARQRRRPMPQEPFRATLIGNLFHSWVESLYTDVGGGGATLEGADLDDEDRADAGLTTAGEADRERLEQFKATFLRSRFAADGKRPSAVELAINSPLGAHTIIGKLDAVYVDEATGEVEIVDWKTGRAPRSADEREGRELQLMCYAHAYSAGFDVPLERIRATLYYVSSDEEITVEDMLSREALIQKLEDAQRKVSRS
ncbi:ATP-dependent helicase [Gulosibacter molinativorax]|uniref:DNA 3'-5' helicase n=1 Tax=Gulosibacter molinativorax TaxID=256821 RepID=A0ABT7C5U9_9MICO|nr:ATP-dependent DNA helicase [Gulosibacter molinativorax]MDJ1370582.1 ATP-dependent helicase [Gulosibacter molinativorax]QUY62002.1 Hypotetical protein [Gulosibacter molinativorax]